MTSSKFILPTLAIAIAILAATLGPQYLNSSNLSTQVIDGIAFPSTINIASTQTFIGGGTRSKWGFKVYAVGIYGESKITKSLSKKYGALSTEDMLKTGSMFSDFSESKGGKTLLLRFHREVGASDVADALGDALKPRLGEEKSKTFQTFILDMVGGDRIVKGSDIYITCKGEKLWASTRGVTSGASTISLKGLCPAIFMVYLGDRPVSPQAKEGFAKGFESLARQ
jgi:hypothetical protein